MLINRELHRSQHIGWLRAAVLGANDGLISTSSLVVGVAAAQAERAPIMLAAVAGLVAGALSMAAGEYVSVSSQADTEQADLALERRELAADPVREHAELAAIYTSRGLAPDLADQVAEQLMAHDAIGAHARDELGLSEITMARPIQAALASAAAFTVGALLPVLLVAFAPLPSLTLSVGASSLVLLLVLGSLAARQGGASMMRGAIRRRLLGSRGHGLHRPGRTSVRGRGLSLGVPRLAASHPRRIRTMRLEPILRAHGYLKTEAPPVLWEAATEDVPFLYLLGEMIAAALGGGNELGQLTLAAANVVVEPEPASDEPGTGPGAGEYVAITVSGGGSWSSDASWAPGRPSASPLFSTLDGRLRDSGARYAYGRTLPAASSMTVFFPRLIAG